jgi:hypothetical protein
LIRQYGQGLDRGGLGDRHGENRSYSKVAVRNDFIAAIPNAWRSGHACEAAAQLLRLERRQAFQLLTRGFDESDLEATRAPQQPALGRVSA